MIKEVEIGKNYALYLLNLYGGTKYNVTVIGKTNIDNVSLNEDKYNVYETFFQPIGLGLTSYYTAIQEKTDIYICRAISSLEPFTISDEKVFIPKSLIDFNETSEYVSAYNFNFQIFPLIKRFDTDDAKDKFIENIKEKIRLKLKELIEFNILSETDISITYDTIYLTKETIEGFENKSTSLWDQYNQRVRTQRKNEEVREEQYNSMLAELRESIEMNNRSTQEYNDKLIELQEEIDKFKALNNANNNESDENQNNLLGSDNSE